jgi:hypothetical protein
VSHPTDWELQEILKEISPRGRDILIRLLRELRELRDQAGERERMAAEEREA